MLGPGAGSDAGDFLHTGNEFREKHGLQLLIKGARFRFSRFAHFFSHFPCSLSAFFLFSSHCPVA